MSDIPVYTDEMPEPTPTDGPSMHDLVAADIAERKDHGLRKYGTILQSGNGRPALRDAYEEVLDLIVYLRQEIEEAAISTYDEWALVLTDASLDGTPFMHMLSKDSEEEARRAIADAFPDGRMFHRTVTHRSTPWVEVTP